MDRTGTLLLMENDASRQVSGVRYYLHDLESGKVLVPDLRQYVTLEQIGSSRETQR